MTNFFITVFIAVINKLMGDQVFNKWVDDRMAKAISQVHTELKADIADLETKLLERVDQLPGQILGDAEKTVESIVGVVPGQVKDQINPLFDGFANLLRSFSINIPGIPNIFPWGNK